MKIWRRISDIIIPTVYADALSYGQILEKIRCALNQVIEWINNTKFVHSINGMNGDVTLKNITFTGYTNKTYNGTENVMVEIPTYPDGGVIAELVFTGAVNETYNGRSSKTINIPSGGVSSINGKTGDVNLTAQDIGAVSADNAVTSVNNMTGDVRISAENIGALPNTVTELPNPKAVRFTGFSKGNYDGRNYLDVTIPNALVTNSVAVAQLIATGSSVGVINLTVFGLNVITISDDAAVKFGNIIDPKIHILFNVFDAKRGIRTLLCMNDYTEAVNANVTFEAPITNNSYAQVYPILLYHNVTI